MKIIEGRLAGVWFTLEQLRTASYMSFLLSDDDFLLQPLGNKKIVELGHRFHEDMHERS